MRNLYWGTAAACLIAVALGATHFALKPRQDEQAALPSPAVEPAAPRAAFIPLPKSMPTVNELLELDKFEPIVVEGSAVEPPLPREFGGVALPGEPRVAALAPERPPVTNPAPRPQQEMPPAVDEESDSGCITRLWHALARTIGGSRAAAQTLAEPPAMEEQSEPVAAKMVLPPIVDYHYHEYDVHSPSAGRGPVTK